MGCSRAKNYNSSTSPFRARVLAHDHRYTCDNQSDLISGKSTSSSLFFGARVCDEQLVEQIHRDHKSCYTSVSYVGEDLNHCHVNLYVILFKLKTLGAVINRKDIFCESEEDLASLRHVAIDKDKTHTFHLSIDYQTLLGSEHSIQTKIRDQDFMVAVMQATKTDPDNYAGSLSHLPPLQRYPEEFHDTNILRAQDALTVAEHLNDKINLSTQTTYTDLHEPLKLVVVLKIHTSTKESLKVEASSC